mgnify:FL=1
MSVGIRSGLMALLKRLDLLVQLRVELLEVADLVLEHLHVLGD